MGGVQQALSNPIQLFCSDYTTLILDLGQKLKYSRTLLIVSYMNLISMQSDHDAKMEMIRSNSDFKAKNTPVYIIISYTYLATKPFKLI